jgi:hypothetical protein
MKAGTASGEKEVQTAGFFVSGVLTLIMTILKLTNFSDWSWWRVSLPISIFVGFNIAYIVVGFIHLTIVDFRRGGPSQNEGPITEQHHGCTFYWISILLFVLFADNLVRYLEGTEQSYWFWILSGRLGAVLIFGSLSMIGLFLYWSGVTRTLNESE